MSKFIDISDILWHNKDGVDFATRAEIESLPPRTLPIQSIRAEWIIKSKADTCYLVECSNCGNHHILGNNIPFEEWKNSDNRIFCGRCGRQMRDITPPETEEPPLSYNAEFGCFTVCSIN